MNPPLAAVHVDPATIDGALIALVAVITLVMGIFQRRVASKTRSIDELNNQRDEIYLLKFATREEMTSLTGRIIAVETRMGMPEEDEQ